MNGLVQTRRRLILAAIVMSSVAWASKAEVPTCPLKAPAHVTKPGIAPSGWKVLVRDGARLTTAGILAGPFDGSGYLAPEKSKVRRDGESQRFTQAWDVRTPPSQEKWLYCGYGSGLEIYKRLPDSVTKCTMKTSVYKERIVKVMKMECETR
jgi:hypothetical protein